MSPAEVMTCTVIIGFLIIEAIGLYLCWVLWRKGVDQCRK